MKSIKHWLKSKITIKLSSLFTKYGIKYSSENCNIKKRNCSILFNQILLSKISNPNEYISIGCAIGRISVWRSFFNMALVGELSLKDVNFSMSVISDKPFYLEAAAMTFKLRRKFKIVCVDIRNISCFLQLESKKDNKELIIDIPDFTWNDIYDLLSANFVSDILRNLFSEDKLHLQTHLKKLKNVDIPFVYTNISYDHLSFCGRQKEKPNIVNRDYLICLLNKKLNKQKDSYIVYENIPEDFINAIICTEDPLFWNHKGIASYFIGLALASNLKEHKVVRGASTITMQLMRNLFLSQERNFLRKAEESILALLLENYYSINKRTILELYVNIIEFAPNIYGLYDACFFYFGKEYTKLTLIEIITLTYIIPRPKHFYEALIIQSSQLETNLYNHIRSYSQIMLHKGLITVDKYINIGMEIRFVERFGILSFGKVNRTSSHNILGQTSLSNLKGIHPRLVKAITEAIANTPVPFIITEGVRTTERQKELYAQGRIMPGPVVTNCDGLVDKSNHQLKEDGYGYAIDLYPYICGHIRIHEPYVPEILQIIAIHIKETAQKFGIPISWGGDWEMKDYSHFELQAFSCN